MKNTAFLALITLLAACGLAACSLAACSNGKVNTSQLKGEMKSREIRRISGAAIIERTMSLGDSLVQTLDAEAAMAQAGTAIKTWSFSGNSFSATAYAFHKTYELVEKEAGVLAAYQYNADNNLAAEPNAQRLPGDPANGGTDLIAYNAPVVINEKLVGMWSLHFPKRFIVLSIED